MRVETSWGVVTEMRLLVAWLHAGMPSACSVTTPVGQVEWALVNLGSQRALTGLCGVSLAFVAKLLRAPSDHRSPRAQAHTGGQKRRLEAVAQACVQRQVHEQEDKKLKALFAPAPGERAP